MSDQWAFGWTQVLTIIGFIITISIAVSGFRTFDRWKREKIEERRIDIALEALSIAYKAVGVFAAIRSPGVFKYEIDELPRVEGESEEERNRKSTYRVPLMRINEQKEFFLRVLELEPRVMAMFGPEVEATFEELRIARAHVQTAAQMLMGRELPARMRTQLEADIWSGLGDDGDRVQNSVEAFKNGIVRLCRPIVDKEFK